MDDVMGLSAGSLPKARRAAGLRARCGDAGVLELVRYIGCLLLLSGWRRRTCSRPRHGPAEFLAAIKRAVPPPQLQAKINVELLSLSVAHIKMTLLDTKAIPLDLLSSTERKAVLCRSRTLETVDYKDLLAIHLLTQLAGSAPRAPRRGARRCRTRRRPC
jgi:hypothetical protein